MAGDYWITGSHDNEALMNCIECSDDSVVVTDLAEANELAAWHDAVCPARVERQRAEQRDEWEKWRRLGRENLARLGDEGRSWLVTWHF